MPVTRAQTREQGRIAFWCGKALSGNPWTALQRDAWTAGWHLAEAEFKLVTKGARRATPGLLERHRPDYAKGGCQPVTVTTRHGAGRMARQNVETHIYIKGGGY
jgi:hypothetical protein